MVSPAAKETGGSWAQRTYEAMAPVYDDFTAHHDYDRWIPDLLKLLERHGLQGNRLLDVGCGTGKSFMPMLPRGWRVTGCDISPAMLERAGEKAGDGSSWSSPTCSSCPSSASSTWSGHSTTRSTTCSAARNWNARWPGCAPTSPRSGLLLFDVNALPAYRTFFAETEAVERGGRRLVWRGLAAQDVAPGSICESRLE